MVQERASAVLSVPKEVLPPSPILLLLLISDLFVIFAY